MESGVIDKRILEKGVTGTYLPGIDASKTFCNYLKGEEWKQLLGKWEGNVHSVVAKAFVNPWTH